MNNKSSSLLFPFSIIAIVNLVFYLPVILKFPGFLYDDFIIFNITSHNNQIFSTNPNEMFYFFVRPISYLFFKFDYLIWGNNYVGMKLVTLVAHIFLILIFYLILKTITELLSKKFNTWLALLTVIVFSIHPTSLIEIYWISNQTELLGLLFYALSLFFFLRYFLNKKYYNLIYVVIFYTLSLLSKQQGIHLPLLFLFVLFFFKDFSIYRDKKLIVSSIICICLMVAYSILNYLLYNSTFDLSHNLIKKPLSLLGNILHAGLPMVSQVIYNYFLLNKVVAAVILSLLLIGFTIFFINEKIPIKNIFKAFLFVLIIFYPRIFAVGNIRINGIIVFWLMILLYLFLTNLGLSVKVIKPIILVIIIFFSVTFILTAKDNLQILTNYKRNTSELSQMVGNNKNLLILNDQYAVTLPSEIYYYKNNSFGVDTSFNVLPIFYNRELRNNFTFNKRMLEIGSEGYIFKIKSLDPLLYLSYFKDMIKEEGIQILKSIPSPSGRGSSYLEIKLPQNFSNNVIYFNGKDWDKINKKKKILRSIRHDKASLKKTGFK